MSIGYVSQQPVISTLTFYNAIANGGKMVKPRFVKAEMENGHIVREFPTEVLVEQICKPSTLRDIQFCLNNVVKIGLGKKAGNGGKLFQVSGKTGTAQIASGKRGYHSGVTRYMVSFCGYFPSEAPKYSCIVCIVKSGLPASGGGQCGPVFSQISQYIMAQSVERKTSDIVDTLSHSSIPNKTDRYHVSLNNLQEVPNVVGMGAKDAIYVLKKCGMEVEIQGTGTVKSQSIKPGEAIEKQQKIKIVLE
jgi:cell division protein FtsI (penicillin-binding protein 3)